MQGYPGTSMPRLKRCMKESLLTADPELTVTATTTMTMLATTILVLRHQALSLETELPEGRMTGLRLTRMRRK
eukprot:916176-Amphidinium_carterae.1